MVISNLYKNLMEHWKKDGYSIYKDQDLSEAGKNDCEELYLNDPLAAEVKNQLATELIEMFFENYHRQYVDDDIINYYQKIVEYELENPGMDLSDDLTEEYRLIVKEYSRYNEEK